MMVHSLVRCFQSLPAPSPAIEADHCHCKPVPSRNGDMGHLTKGILVPGVNEQTRSGTAARTATVSGGLKFVRAREILSVLTMSLLGFEECFLLSF